MTVRTRRALSALGTFRRLQTRHLEDVMFAGSPVTPRSRRVLTSRILRGLRSRGVVEALRPPTSGSHGGWGELIYHLSEDGRRYLARIDPAFRGLRRPPPDAASTEHALMAADVYVAFLRAARNQPGHDVSAWDPDRCAADLLGASGVVPDGHLVYQTEEWEVEAFIEIDLGTESPSRFAHKVSDYLAALREGAWQARLATWPLVLTITTSALRATTLRGAAEKVLRREPGTSRLATVALFYFVALADLLATSDPLGPVWQLAGRDGRHALIPGDDIDGPAKVGMARTTLTSVADRRPSSTELGGHRP